MTGAGTLRRVVALGFLGAAGLALVATATFQRPLQARQDDARGPAAVRVPRFVDGELLVKFKRGAAARARAGAHDAARSRRLRNYAAVGDLELVQLPADLSVPQAIDLYRGQPDVLYAEPNYVIEAATMPNDPLYSLLWGLDNSGQNGGVAHADIDAPHAWNITTGSSSVVVAVLDSGIDYNHPDLAPNLWRNPADCNVDGIDNDGNGYADDCYGIDTLNHDSDPRDDNQHGTHVAGTIGAAGNNNIGVVGVNWQVRLLPCKFLNFAGNGSTAGAIACLDYVKTMKDRGANIVATNNSWGGPDYSRALLDAIDAQRQSGILFITAAGNAGIDADYLASYPANYYLPNIISVAATTSSDTLAPFSNFGRRTVHLAAPGQNILSTSTNSSYAMLSGTSMAAPYVSGVAALLKAQDPARDWRAIKNLLLASGDTVPALSSTVTGKRLNAYSALSCLDREILAPLQPSGATAPAGVPVPLAMLHVNCGQPAGDVTLTVDPGGEPVTLLDTGLVPDQVADDGIYSALWTPPGPGTFTFTDANGGTSRMIVLDDYAPSPAAYNYRTITGTSLDMDDPATRSIALPFPVRFGGHPFDTVYVSSNGNFSFTAPFTEDINNQPLPTGRIDTLVAPFWDHLQPASHTDRNVFWAVVGDAPHRELIIEWRGLELWRTPGLTCPGFSITFQVVMFEDKSDVLFNYADTVFGGGCSFADRGRAATSGLQIARNKGYGYGFNTANLDSGSAILWSTPSQPPTITWDPPAAIIYGTVLGPAQLNATANVDGTFVYSPPAGTRLNAGLGQTLSVTFSPANGTGFLAATAVVTIDVLKATPVVTWDPPAAIVVGTPLGSAQLNATASVPGRFTYSPPLDTVLPVGTAQTLSAIFTPDDAANYNAVPASVTIDVQPPPHVMTLVAPNGGGTARIGGTQIVSFTHNLGAGELVSLDLSRDGGATWSPIAMLTTVNPKSGSFTWLVTGPPTAQARMRASWAAEPAVFDVSDAAFTIADRITVTSPNGSGSLRAGATQHISFTHTLGVGQGVQLDVSRDGGATWAPVATMMTTNPVSGSYAWMITPPATSQARIRASKAADATVFDTSDVNFTILEPITVTAPNTNGSWLVGAVRAITWAHSLSAGETVNIDVSRDGGETWSAIAAGVPGGVAPTGSYAWTVSGPSTPHGRVRVSRTSDPSISDVSDVDFNVIVPVVTVTSPNGAGAVLVGAPRPITFTHSLGAGQMVAIDISRDGGATWTAITTLMTVAPTSASYNWIVSGPPSTQTRIRVSWAPDPDVFDISDVNFIVQ